MCPFVAALLPCLDAMKELYPAGENLCTTLPMRMLSKWPWISRCGDYWQQTELRTDGACRIMMMMMIDNIVR